MIYPLVKEMAAVGATVRVPVAVACRVLGFSKQGYYKWLKQPVSAREAEERELIDVLHQLHDDDPEGGYRVLADDIAELGYELSERRVWRLCRVAGIQSVFTRRKTRYKKAGAPVHDDLVNRQFSADGPNELWLTDITEHRTREGKVYLCAIKDVFSNRIVGYSIDSRMKSSLAVAALEQAVAAARQATRNLAKRQLTWLRADPDIRWIGALEERELVPISDALCSACGKLGLPTLC